MYYFSNCVLHLNMGLLKINSTWFDILESFHIFVFVSKYVQICLWLWYLFRTTTWVKSDIVLKHGVYCGSLMHVSLWLNSSYFWTPNHSGRIQEDVKGYFLHGRLFLPHFLLTLLRWYSKANHTETHQKVTDPNVVRKSTFSSQLSPLLVSSSQLTEQWLSCFPQVWTDRSHFSVESLHWLTDLHTVKRDAHSGLGIECNWLTHIQHDDLAQTNWIHQASAGCGFIICTKHRCFYVSIPN